LPRRWYSGSPRREQRAADQAGAQRGTRLDRRTADCRADVQPALSEACTNVIRHAEPSQDYQVLVGFDERQCTIEMTDDGLGVDDLAPTDTEDPPLPWPFDESARGLRIIARVADEVEVRRRRPKGTLLRFVNQLSWVQDQRLSNSAKPRPR
jgi:serine/threonine-protein kinase RsbW